MEKIDRRAQILNFLRINGPSQPNKISKEIQTDMIMASAYLSELADRDQVKISHLKVGSSPLYYLPGQEQHIERFADNLNDKQKKAYSLLMEKKVLRDIALDPVIRVALSDIKDFAVPLNVTHNNTKETFWKWHMLDNKEAEEAIKKIMGIKEEKKEQEKEEVKEIKKKEEQNPSDEIKELKKPKEEVKEKPREEQKTIKAAEKEDAKEESKEKPKQKAVQKDKEGFEQAVRDYFSTNKISVLEEEIIKRGSEVDFVIELPSVVGILRYYCKAKGKAKITDSDIASAFAKGQAKKMPILLITSGELTKKAVDSLQEFKGITVKKI